MSFGSVVFGDNQFLGVNHASQARAVALFRRYAEADAIIEVLGWAYDAGIRDFMFTTHDRYDDVFREIIRSQMFPEMRFSPCLPYAHKYANAMAERGMASVVLTNLRHTSVLRTGFAVIASLRKDFSGLMRLLAELELFMCKGLPIRGVFLQNITTDLLFALGAHTLLEQFHRYVTDHLGAEAGFITMNHPTAVNILSEEIGLDRPWICSNYNIAGFRTNPSLADVIASFACGKSRNIAMSVFASGRATGEDCLRFAASGKGVDAVIFGSSNRQNIRANADLIRSGVG